MKNNLGAATQTQLFRRRLVVANALVLACFSLLVARLVYLQVFSHEEFAQKAESNRTSVVPIAPERGEILDRHGVVMARNNPGFSLEITPEDIELINEKEKRDDAIARLIGELGQVVPITESDLRKFKKIKEDSQAHDSLPILTKLTEEEVFKLSAVLFRYKGVEIKKRSFRDYPNGNMGVHVMGYIGRINKKDQERLAEENLKEAYHGTTHIGKVGIEQS